MVLKTYGMKTYPYLAFRIVTGVANTKICFWSVYFFGYINTSSRLQKHAYVVQVRAER